MTPVNHGSSLIRQTTTRIPTPQGEFSLHLYVDSADGKEHLALVSGEVAKRSGVLVRVHSECFTGDVLGSLRCDCGEQLDVAIREISQRGCGVLVYLRQEGRGIGLLDKLRAYNLQDEGYDTVEANLMLGHEVDARDYGVAAQILTDLQVESVELLTNNPLKMSALRERGIPVTRRVPIQVQPGPDNLAYLRTKAKRMNHFLSFGPIMNGTGHRPAANGSPDLEFAPILTAGARKPTRPAVTVSYAQSLDGSIATSAGEAIQLSGDRSMKMTHRLRASHDAILVGIGTALADDPRLTVRLVEGPDPQPVVIDSKLRLPASAQLFSNGASKPWIVTTVHADPDRQAILERAGARVLRVASGPDGLIDLSEMLEELGRAGITSVMVEGGSRIIGSFLDAKLVDQVVITVAPRLIGGMRVLSNQLALNGNQFPSIDNVHYQRLGEDIVLWGKPVWPHE